MPTKKGSTKKGGARTSGRRETAAGLRRRAEAIAGGGGYDADTREAVRHSLAVDGPAELAETVRRAERGEVIVDTRVYEHRAAHVLAFINSPDTPKIVVDALCVFLAHAQNATGLPIAADGGSFAESDARALSELFAMPLGYDEGGLFEDRGPGEGDYLIKPATRGAHTLADHISAVLRDDDTPAELYNAMREALDEMILERDVRDSPEVLRAALEAHRKGGAQR